LQGFLLKIYGLSAEKFANSKKQKDLILPVMKLDGDVLPALDERMTNWIDLGVKLKENWDGQSINIVNASNGSIIYISKDIFQFSEHVMIHFAK
jgi:hypothetical protein